MRSGDVRTHSSITRKLATRNTPAMAKPAAARRAGTAGLWRFPYRKKFLNGWGLSAV